MRRRLAILVLAALAFVAVPTAGPAFGAQAPAEPSGPSGTGNNPASGQTGGGAEAPTSRGNEGNGLLPVALVGVLVLVVGGAVMVARRHRQVNAGESAAR